MKKAVITTGGHQYVVAEGQTLDVDLISLEDGAKSVSFEALMVIDGENVTVGAPTVAKAKVTADVVTDDFKGDKVTAIRYKAKKRVHKLHGHRQRHTTIKIASIA